MKTTIALALFVFAGCGVDETGYLVRPEITYTAPAPLSDADTPIMVVGNAGAIAEAGGELTITNDRSSASATAVIEPTFGSFVAIADGRSGDTLVLSYRLDGDAETLSLDVTDDLTGVSAPSCILCSGSLVSAPDAGQVTVFLKTTDDPIPPFVIANQTTGYARRVDTLDVDPQLPAAIGDTVCAHRLSPTADAASPSNCQAVPAP